MSKLFSWLFAAALVIGLGSAPTLIYADEHEKDPVEEAEDSGDKDDKKEAETKSYSKAVQDNCGQDYKTYCGEYGLESNALRNCMNRNGEKLTDGCVKALVADGLVSQAEVDRRKKEAGR